jgi:hypothetical protein
VEPLAATLLLSARYRAAHSLKGALVLASHAASLVQFQLTYGFWSALAASALFAPMIAAATAWFENNRYPAVSLGAASAFCSQEVHRCRDRRMGHMEKYLPVSGRRRLVRPQVRADVQ